MSEGLDEAVEHSPHLRSLTGKVTVVVAREVAEVVGEERLVVELVGRAGAWGMSRNRASSLALSRPQPSAMFDGTEVADLRRWAVSPKRSSGGMLVERR